MSGRVTRKRARTDEQENTVVDQVAQPENPNPEPMVEDNTLFKRDEEFWLEDGTAILVARDIEFRVYSGLLAYHSPVFKEEFSKPHPKRSTLVPDGGFLLCPVVHFSDTPEDLRHLLRAFMPRKDSSLYDMKHPSFANLSAGIRLGQKYKITPLYEQSLLRLKSFFPRDYDAWTKLEYYHPANWDPSEVVGVVNLARSIGELSILPSAFLSCMLTDGDTDAIFHGFTREDGERESLTPDDLAICVRAKTKICEANVANRLQALLAYSHRCRDPGPCKSALKKSFAALHMHLDALMDIDMDRALSHFLKDDKLNELRVCRACDHELTARLRAGSQKVWNSLPELLGIDIPGWDEGPVEANAT